MISGPARYRTLPGRDGTPTAFDAFFARGQKWLASHGQVEHEGTVDIRDSRPPAGKIQVYRDRIAVFLRTKETNDRFRPEGHPYRGSITDQSRGTNGMAVAGLVCARPGFRVWFLGGILGVILGLIGLRKSRNPQVGGRGLAVSAIVIGVLSILGVRAYSRISRTAQCTLP